MAVGVGQQRIVGRVHMCQLQIAENFLPVSFSVLEEQPMEMILGLDMLRRHQCVLDLRENVLHIGTTNTVVPFLGEGDLPRSARLNSVAGDEDYAGGDVHGSNSDSSGSSSSSNSSNRATEPASTVPFAATAASEPPGYPESVITNLMQMGGFTRAQALDALAKSNGDGEAAGLLLLQTFL